MSPRRRRGRPVHGIVLLDKPAGMSSNQALQRVKRLFEAQKAGHTGNLDPFATGMLPVCLGEATKTAAFMLDADKRYRAVAELGTRTGTGDPEGATVETAPVPELDQPRIEAAMAGLTGNIRQVPPMHSALKHQGRPLYELARRGETVERKAREVTIHSLELKDWSSPRLDFEVHCSKGTYVRVLAEDLARALGTVAHLVALRRLEVAPFDPQGMVTLAQLEQAEAADTLDAHLLAADAGLVNWPVLSLAGEAAERFCNGNPVPVAGDAPRGDTRVHDSDGAVLGLGRVQSDGKVHPNRVMAAKSS